jgi:23S rRNA (uracil1939-C5)-methyltransferase
MSQQITLQIKRIGIYGEGIGEWEGKTVFVLGALPGEEVVAEVKEEKKTFLRARLVKRLTESPHRRVPICPVFGRCGGCQLMHLDYEEQLKVKRQRVVDALQRIGKLEVEVNLCEPSPQHLSYRNKIQLPTRFEGRLKMGLYAFNSHDLVEIERCYIHCDQGEEVFVEVKRQLEKFPAVARELRHVLIRSAKESLVVFVTNKKKVEGLDELAGELMKLQSLKGVVQNINPVVGNRILGSDYQTIKGQGWVEERVCGLTFKVSPASFFQVNSLVAEKLYRKAEELCNLKGNEVVVDAYCGVGTLALILAKQAGKVIGVEQVSEAIIDAKENARRNQITNAEFHTALAEEFIHKLSHLDVAVLNPPRKGCDTALLTKLATLKPALIVYVSCDPATLARDLAYLCSQGYKAETAFPFDMFPQTVHVETVIALRRDDTDKSV